MENKLLKTDMPQPKFLEDFRFITKKRQKRIAFRLLFFYRFLLLAEKVAYYYNLSNGLYLFRKTYRVTAVCHALNDIHEVRHIL